MIAADEDALICDFAETYHIYNYKSLPPIYAATLAKGLRDDSRIKIKLTGQRVSMDTMLRISAVDALNILVWQRTKDGQKNRNRPISLLEKITEQEPNNPIMGFDSAAEFERVRARIINGKQD